MFADVRQYSALSDVTMGLRQLVSVAQWLVRHHRRSNSSQSPDDGTCGIYRDDELQAGKPDHNGIRHGLPDHTVWEITLGRRAKNWQTKSHGLPDHTVWGHWDTVTQTG